MIFRKKKYYFNQVTLTFEEIKTNKIKHIGVILAYIFGILIIAGASGYFLNRLFGSQETRDLENKIAVLKQEMNVLFEKGHQIRSSLQNDLFVRDNTYRVILQMDTIPSSLLLAGTGGSSTENLMAKKGNLEYQLNDMIKLLNNQLKVQSGSFKMLYEKAMEYTSSYSHLPAIIPVAEKDLIMISSDYGTRTDPFFFISKTHCGLDFVAPTGKNIYATGDGIVTFAKYSRTGYGNEIVIDHMFGFGSRYAHLNTIIVKAGEQVKRGQIIGTVGETGRTTGPHLHYEVLFEHKPVNPSYYFDTSLTKEEFAQIINKANEHNKKLTYHKSFQ